MRDRLPQKEIKYVFRVISAGLGLALAVVVESFSGRNLTVERN